MMAEMPGWESKQIDYNIAISQSRIDSDVYLHLPAGFHVDGEDQNETYFLKLKKILFGICQEASNWFDMLKTGLEDGGFKKTKQIHVFLYKIIFIVIFYVGDCCIFSKKKEIIEKSIKDIQVD